MLGDALCLASNVLLPRADLRDRRNWSIKVKGKLRPKLIDAKLELSSSIEAQLSASGLDLGFEITRAHGMLWRHSIMSSRDHIEAVIPSSFIAFHHCLRGDTIPLELAFNRPLVYATVVTVLVGSCPDFLYRVSSLPSSFSHSISQSTNTSSINAQNIRHSTS